LHLLINRVPAVSTNARLIQQTLRHLFQEQKGIQILRSEVPANEAIHRAAVRGLPVHRVETRRPTGRLAPAALEVMQGLAGELFPQWQPKFNQVSGKAGRGSLHG